MRASPSAPAGSTAPPFAPPARNSAASAGAAPPPLPFPAFEIEPPRAHGEPLAGRPTGLVAASAADEELARWNVGGSSDPRHASNRPGYHPGVRVIVETRPLRRLPKQSPNRRLLTEQRLLAHTRNVGYWPFRACFEVALRKNSKTPGGKTRVRVGIAQSGKVYAARLLGTELRDRDAARCLERAARSLEFSPAPAKRLDVDVSVELWPGDAPLPTIAPSIDAISFDRAAVLQAVNARASELAACCTAGIARDPRLWGRASLIVSLAEDGRVTAVREDESRFPDPAVVACFARELAAAPPMAQPPGKRFEYALGVRCGAPPEPAPPSQPPVVPPAPLSPLDTAPEPPSAGLPPSPATPGPVPPAPPPDSPPAPPPPPAPPAPPSPLPPSQTGRVTSPKPTVEHTPFFP